MVSSMVIFLFAAALSATRAQQFGNCGQKSVTPITPFDFEEFAENTWTYEYFPEDSFYSNIDSSTLVFSKPDPSSGADRATMTFNKSDGTKIYLVLRDIHLAEGKRYETLMDNNGKLTNTHFQIVFYGYQPGNYAQFYVCKYANKGGSVDFRYVVVRKGYTLTKEDIANIKNNDDNQGFSGRLVRRPGASDD